MIFTATNNTNAFKFACSTSETFCKLAGFKYSSRFAHAVNDLMGRVYSQVNGKVKATDEIEFVVSYRYRKTPIYIDVRVNGVSRWEFDYCYFRSDGEYGLSPDTYDYCPDRFWYPGYSGK